MDDISDNTALPKGSGEQGNGHGRSPSEFASGDQDYDSAWGWDPDREWREKFLAEHKKKHPRDYAKPPEMLFVRPAQEFVESGARGGPMKQLFGPFWPLEEVAVLFGPTGL